MLGNKIFSFDIGQCDIISGVMSFVMQKIMSELEEPLKGMVADVQNGVWKGKGADKFVAEMTGEASQGLAATREVANQFNGGMRAAMEIMNQAQNAANNIVNQIQGFLNDW